MNEPEPVSKIDDCPIIITKLRGNIKIEKLQTHFFFKYNVKIKVFVLFKKKSFFFSSAF